LSLSQLSVYQEIQVNYSLESLKLEFPEAGLFSWTLTHPSRAFAEVEPVFNSQVEFVQYLDAHFSTASIPSKIGRLALPKIDREWDAWVNLHLELPFDEKKLDNMLMVAIYRIILDRDLKRCVLCHSMTELTIHHIIQKRRNMACIVPPFGRSVPTNLVTLCRRCHAHFDPMVLA